MIANGTDFTRPRRPGEKELTRRLALDFLRDGSLPCLWSKDGKYLRHDWVELAGKNAPTCQLLLGEGALGHAKFIGIDKTPTNLATCRRLYRGQPAEWIDGELITMLPDPRLSNVGVVVHDSLRATAGKSTIEKDLDYLCEFAYRQQGKLGEFLLVVNAAQPKRTPLGRAKGDYVALLSRYFPTAAFCDQSIHVYMSNRTYMMWAAVRICSPR